MSHTGRSISSPFRGHCVHAGIIHLGATSCFVTDNADLIVMRDAVRLLIPGLCALLHQMATVARQYKSTACLSYTHLQPAQPQTVGKRVCMWMEDIVMDLDNFEQFLEHKLK